MLSPNELSNLYKIISDEEALEYADLNNLLFANLSNYENLYY